MLTKTPTSITFIREVDMNKVLQVANYILSNAGPMSAMKLQKLVYYSQAWSLALNGQVLFDSEIQAWAFGPVSPTLFKKHGGNRDLTKKFLEEEGIDKLNEREMTTIDKVINTYNKFDGDQLSNLTHSETPWINAREGLANLERGNREITHASMKAFYKAMIEAKKSDKA
jgi:uncharacterized phage-associated protein